MERVFDRSIFGKEAAWQMLGAYDYAIKFCTLVASCGWNDCTMCDGLSKVVKDELVSGAFFRPEWTHGFSRLH